MNMHPTLQAKVELVSVDDECVQHKPKRIAVVAATYYCESNECAA
jgi:hypothetical protein